MNLEQEKDLIERAKSSSEAFGELYDKYYDQIFGYALRRSADVDVAKDITSAVFFKALTRINGYRWEGVPFSHWLYRIAGREVADHFNKRKREIDLDIDTAAGKKALRDGPGSGESATKRYDDYLDIHNYVSRLPAKYQEVMTFKYFEDMDITQIAGILHKPEGTVKSLLHRGIEKLRKMMDAGGPK